MSYTDVRVLNSDFRQTSFAGATTWRLLEFLERIVAGILLILSAPVLICVAALISIVSRRSPLVAHRRVASGGNTLWVLKLRTMWDRTAKIGESQRHWLVQKLPPTTHDSDFAKSANDPRITSALAAFCRRYSVDELPQLWHVVRGEMALVGPRPLTEHELDRYYGSEAAAVLSRKPGISGLWQIRGRSRLGYRQRRRFDIFLVRNWSLKLYLLILFATVPRVLSGKDAW